MTKVTTPYWRELLTEGDDPVGERVVESMKTTTVEPVPFWREEARIDALSRTGGTGRPRATERVAEEASFFDAAHDVLDGLAEDGAAVSGPVRAATLAWAAERDGVAERERDERARSRSYLDEVVGPETAAALRGGRA